ncbi:MAG: A/G-specific adenine glycosylase [Candidatus Aminicenantes bacterium]|nr:A/G-specific adenine glycosylase [Candidatus Aminicenantes bacterium]
MLNRQDTAVFQRQLLHWYQEHHRKLPWRETRDPYKIWVSEIMLQQTTVQAVLPYYQKWLKRFPDVQTLSQAPLQKVLKAWEGLGYYQRAKNLHRAAKVITDRHQGIIPQDFLSLKALPGFGPYTTAAVLSFAFHKPYPVLDGNIRRVLMRLENIKQKAKPSVDKTLKPFLSSLFAPKNSSVFNQAFIELGALICRPQNPSCLLCPIQRFCLAFHHGTQEIIPLPKKMVTQKVNAVLGIIKHQDCYLIQKRPSQGLMADLWEFPGGKIKSGETLEQALRREIKEELGTNIDHERFLTQVTHSYTRFRVTLTAFACTLEKKPSLNPRTHRWVKPQEFQNFPFPSGSVKVIQYLRDKQNIDKEDGK